MNGWIEQKYRYTPRWFGARNRAGSPKIGPVSKAPLYAVTVCGTDS